jgi:hypothetical protein
VPPSTSLSRLAGSTDSIKMNALGWITVLVMCGALAGLLYSLLTPLHGN